MKKLLLVLIALLFALPVESKILIISSSTGIGNSERAREIEGRLFKSFMVGGVEYYVMQSDDTSATTTDSTGIWHEASSGDYSMAVCLGLPILSGGYDSAAELTAAGWPKLHQWVNRADSMAFPINLFIPLQQYVAPQGVWCDSITGIIEKGDYFSTSNLPIKGENGDSTYAITHLGTDTNFPIVASNDTLDWVYPLAWVDSTTGGYDGKYAMYWMTKGSGNHSVTYMHAASTSYLAGYFASAIAMFEKYQTIEAPLSAEGFGHAAGTFGSDTTNGSGNLLALIDSIVVWDAKFEFITNTPQWVKGDSLLRDAWPWLETDIAANSDNLRMSIYAMGNWIDSTKYWISYLDDYTQDSMETIISRGLDSIASYPNLAAVIETDIFIGPTGFLNAQGDMHDILKALAVNGIDKIYLYGTSYYDIQPSATIRSNHTAMKTGIKYNSSTYYDIKFYPWGTYWAHSYMDANGINQTTVTERASFQSVAIKSMMGEYANAVSMSGSEADIRFVKKWGHYQPGILFRPMYIFGDNNLLEALTSFNGQKNMINYIVATHGNGVNTEVIKYAWMTEVKWDRYNDRLWPNDHVTR